MSDESLPLSLSTPPAYPLEVGSGERLKTFLGNLLPQLLGTLAGELPPMARAAVGSLPMLLERQTFTYDQAVSLLETLDSLVAAGFQTVLGVEAE